MTLRRIKYTDEVHSNLTDVYIEDSIDSSDVRRRKHIRKSADVMIKGDLYLTIFQFIKLVLSFFYSSPQIMNFLIYKVDLCTAVFATSDDRYMFLLLHQPIFAI